MAAKQLKHFTGRRVTDSGIAQQPLSLKDGARTVEARQCLFIPL
jgi:hypothetical protein